MYSYSESALNRDGEYNTEWVMHSFEINNSVNSGRLDHGHLCTTLIQRFISCQLKHLAYHPIQAISSGNLVEGVGFGN